jgi:hypothetical protein
MKLLFILLIIFVLYAVAENRFMLSVRHEKLGGNIRAVHISDLHKRHFGVNNQYLCRKIRMENPDIIIVSGDIVTRDCTDFSVVESTLREMCGIADVYVIFGNHETDLTDDAKKQFINAVKSSGAVLLRNETICIDIKNRRINLTGIELPHTVYKKDGGYRSLDILTKSGMNELVGTKPDGDTILLAHNPLFADVYAEWGADYTVSGHVHGGMIRIPFTGKGLLSPERKLFPKYTKGIYEIGDMKLLVSSGLGKFRLFNPPEIVVYDI